jgi:hypothetical protein
MHLLGAKPDTKTTFKIISLWSCRAPTGWEELQRQSCPDNMAWCWMTCLPLPSCSPAVSRQPQNNSWSTIDSYSSRSYTWCSFDKMKLICKNILLDDWVYVAILRPPLWSRPSECLDWQPSQFINIVGKDDRAIPACAVGGGDQIAARHCCRQLSPAQLLYFPQFTKSSLSRPPTLR